MPAATNHSKDTFVYALLVDDFAQHVERGLSLVKKIANKVTLPRGLVLITVVSELHSSADGADLCGATDDFDQTEVAWQLFFPDVEGCVVGSMHISAPAVLEVSKQRNVDPAVVFAHVVVHECSHILGNSHGEVMDSSDEENWNLLEEVAKT